MNTNARLSKLESGASVDAITQFVEPLARLLGVIDSIFWPERRPLFNMAGIKQQRRQYLQIGTTWAGSTGGGSARAWKSDQRLRTAMAAAGLVKLTRTKSNLPLVKLTSRGEHAARSLVGQPADRVACVLLRLRLEQGATETTPQHRPGGWCSESWLFDSDYKERPASTSWDRPGVLILPLLVSGVVESRPTTQGHVYYRSSGIPIPELEIPESDLYAERLTEIYFESFFGSLQRRDHQEPTSEIIIPLSATR